VNGSRSSCQVVETSPDGLIEATVVKASKPMTAATSENRTIRCSFFFLTPQDLSLST
jgi:hypothetical protein